MRGSAVSRIAQCPGGCNLHPSLMLTLLQTFGRAVCPFYRIFPSVYKQPVLLWVPSSFLLSSPAWNMQKFPKFDLIICSQLGSSSLVLERDWKKHQCYFSHNAGSFVSRLSSAVSASAAYLTIFGNVYSGFFPSDTRSKILVWGTTVDVVGYMDLLRDIFVKRV